MHYTFIRLSTDFVILVIPCYSRIFFAVMISIQEILRNRKHIFWQVYIHYKRFPLTVVTCAAVNETSTPVPDHMPIEILNLESDEHHDKASCKY